MCPHPRMHGTPCIPAHLHALTLPHNCTHTCSCTHTHMPAMPMPSHSPQALTPLVHPHAHATYMPTHPPAYGHAPGHTIRLAHLPPRMPTCLHAWHATASPTCPLSHTHMCACPHTCHARHLIHLPTFTHAHVRMPTCQPYPCPPMHSTLALTAHPHPTRSEEH